MIERLPNLPIARLFLIIGMGYISGKQKMCGFAPGFGLRCAAPGRQVTGLIASGAAPEYR